MRPWFSPVTGIPLVTALEQGFSIGPHTSLQVIYMYCILLEGHPPTISHRQMNIVGSSFLYYKKFTDTITRPLYGHELFPSCLCWSVNGTYWTNDKLASLIELCKIKTSLEFERTLTPMTFCELTFPASSLSTCSINCIKVPTGINMRPGFASCSIKAGGNVGAAAPTWIAS